MTDRELLLEWEAERDTEKQALYAVQREQARAVGLVAFCDLFMDTMLRTDDQHQPRFSRAEAMALLCAAVRR